MLVPIGPRVIILPDKPIDKYGRIHLPDAAQKKVTHGTVVAIGELEDGSPFPMQPGDHVIYSEFAGIEIKHDNGDGEGEQTYLCMVLKDVFCIVVERYVLGADYAREGEESVSVAVDPAAHFKGNFGTKSP